MGASSTLWGKCQDIEDYGEKESPCGCICHIMGRMPGRYGFGRESASGCIFHIMGEYQDMVS